MRQLKRKIKSERGASIIIALFLFLVCSVISSIVITAATAASGRASKLVESDQRYYSVTSAAGLLTDLIVGEKGSIDAAGTIKYGKHEVIIKKETVTTSGRVIMKDDTQYIPSSSKTTYSVEIGDGGKGLPLDKDKYSATDLVLLSAAKVACSLSDTQLNLDGKKPFDETTLQVKDANNSEIGFLQVKVERKTNAIGRITMTVSNANDSSALYKLELTFAPSRNEKQLPPVNVTETKNEADGSVTETSITTDTQYISMIWEKPTIKTITNVG